MNVRKSFDYLSDALTQGRTPGKAEPVEVLGELCEYTEKLERKVLDLTLNGPK